MSHGDGPPPIFEEDDFPYWEIRMEAYLEALDVRVLRAASQGFPKSKDPTNLQGDEVNYEKWNAKARKTLFRGLCNDVFNRVRNHKDARCREPNTGIPNKVELANTGRRHSRSNEDTTVPLVRMAEDRFRLARPSRTRLHLARPSKG